MVAILTGAGLDVFALVVLDLKTRIPKSSSGKRLYRVTSFQPRSTSAKLSAAISASFPFLQAR
jgi:hypothetical protein